MTNVATAIVRPTLPTSMSCAPGISLRGEWVYAWLEALGDVDVAAWCRARRLTSGALLEPLCRVPLDAVAELLAGAAVLRRDPLLGVHLAQRRRPRDLLHYLLISQETVAGSIAQLARFAELIVPGATACLSDSADMRALVLWPSLPGAYRQVVEAGLATIAIDLVEMAGAGVRLDHVRLRGRALAPAAAYERVFGCAVRFEQPHDALVLPAGALQTRLRRRNSAVAAQLERAARLELEIASAASVHERVESILGAALRDGDRCRRAAVARRLACSPRALRRALEGEGTSFREIEEGVRRALALELVADGSMNLATVAACCGFAGLPAFSKAFRRWTVCAPSEFRRRQTALRRRARGRRRAVAAARSGDGCDSMAAVVAQVAAAGTV